MTSSSELPYYLDYLKRTEKFPQSFYHKPKHRQVFQFLEKLPQGSLVLDAACGIGHITGKYCDQYKIIGIDEQAPAVEYSKNNYGGQYVHADLYKIPFADNYFDGILFLDSIEHFTDPVSALKELSRVLKPGGRILICTSNYGNPLWYILENTWHRLFAGNCRTYSKEVHPTRYNAKLLHKHNDGLFKEISLFKKMLTMELFYLGEKEA